MTDDSWLVYLIVTVLVALLFMCVGDYVGLIPLGA